MPKVFLCSDTHFGISLERMDIMQRPHDSENQLFKFWLNHVSPEDLVIHLGDVCDQGNAEHLNHLYVPGRKWLIRGNHDRAITDEQFAPFFEKVFPENAVVKVELAGFQVALSHYPHHAVPDAFNISGHIHSAWKYQKNMLNASIDVHHFKLLDSKKIPFYLKAIEEFYDQDVWVADHPANKAHEERGKAGYYFAEPTEIIESKIEFPVKEDFLDDVTNRFCEVPYTGPEIELEYEDSVEN